MKTKTAIVAHSAVGLAQAAAIVPAVTAHPVLPWWAALLIQIGLIFGQGALAQLNSTSSPSGQPLPPA